MSNFDIALQKLRVACSALCTEKHITIDTLQILNQMMNEINTFHQQALQPQTNEQPQNKKEAK